MSYNLRQYIHQYPVFTIAVCGLIYSSIHILLRLSLSSTIPIDDVWENVFSQKMRLQYTYRNPPLYTWLLYGIQQITGPTLFGFLLLKYALWTLTSIFLYKAIYTIRQNISHGFVAAAAPLLLYQIGWNAHEGVTQTALLTTVLAASLWAWSNILLKQRGFHWLCVCACIGILSKYSYFAFVVCALGSCLIVHKGVFTYKRFWLVFFLPFSTFCTLYSILIWAKPVAVSLSRQSGFDLVTGVIKVVPAWIGFLVPLILVLLLLDRGFVKRPCKTRPERWAMWFTGIAFAICLCIGSISPDSIRERYMHVFVLPILLWIIPKLDLTNRFKKWYKTSVLVTTGIVLTIRFVTLADGSEEICGRKCRNLVPYAQLYDSLAPFAHGTLVSTNAYIAGNLRSVFPHTTVIWVSSFATTPARPCVHVETANKKTANVVTDWQSLLRQSGYRQSYWRIVPDPTCTLIP